MNEKYFVPFETAQRLKGAGYPQEVDYTGCVYTLPRGWFYPQLDIDLARRRSEGEPIAAPTYHEVLSWLEGKGVVVCADKVNGFWCAMLVHTNDYDAWEASDIQDSREQALDYGINWALDYLQKGEI